MATTYEDVVAVFESTFLERVALSDDLVFQWFKMACGEFSTQISQLYFNNEKKIFTDIDGNDIVLNKLQNRIRNFSFSTNLDKKQSLYYISIYTGKGDGIGRITKKDCYQRNQKISKYKLNFDCIRKNTITSKTGKDFLL